jgi:hypothetical protein
VVKYADQDNNGVISNSEENQFIEKFYQRNNLKLYRGEFFNQEGKAIPKEQIIPLMKNFYP